MSEKIKHKPVMVEEILDFLKLREGMIIVDGTIGAGGHAQEIIKRISPHGKLIGIDRDSESLRLAEDGLKEYGSQCIFVYDNFCNIDRILTSLEIKEVNGVILDLGISSFQLDNAGRGFSFTNEGPLDMRMDRKNSLSAFDLINHLSRQELASILWRFGQERFSNRIADIIVNNRNKIPIDTTTKLSSLILKVMPRSHKHQRIHPATRAFQAFRIAVNQELESLEIFLGKIGKFMNKNGRLCIISFHSLEDRIVKTNFRALTKTMGFRLVAKKPLIPKEEEIRNNPRSRSAKLRVLEKI